MSTDVDNYIKSCDSCLRYNKAGNRTVRMVERPVITEPFEMIAVDIVGPLPKGKGGAKYLLTMICLASRWPEALPLRTMTATEVAEGLVGIFAKTGLPTRLLTDQGKSFMSRVCKRMCELEWLRGIMGLKINIS